MGGKPVATIEYFSAQTEVFFNEMGLGVVPATDWDGRSDVSVYLSIILLLLCLI